VELERDVEKMKKAEYMAAHLGEEYSGTVSGVTSFGMYVELPNTVEGLVSLGSMEDDYYVFDESHRQLYGQRHGRTYQFGDTVKIRVAAASPEDREIDFVLA
jgi:ribonuclease R